MKFTNFAQDLKECRKGEMKHNDVKRSMLAPTARPQKKHGPKPHSPLPAKQSPRDSTGLNLGHLSNSHPSHAVLMHSSTTGHKRALLNGPPQRKGSATKLRETMHSKNKVQTHLGKFLINPQARM